jgi:two-component system sensor histidine kinase and response regulator WspE
MIKARWVGPFSQSLVPLKRLHEEAAKSFDRVREQLPQGAAAPALDALADAQRQLSECQRLLADRLAALDWFDRRAQNGLQRLYDEALACRMRPFRDGTQSLPLLVRTVSRSLGKRVALRIEGEGTQVDRDLLSRLDAPLGHLLRNAIDHGIESPDEPRAAGEGPFEVAARYTLGGVVGRGGMGRVRVARDHRLRREVAFKELNPGLIADTAAAGRMRP